MMGMCYKPALMASQLTSQLLPLQLTGQIIISTSNISILVLKRSVVHLLILEKM